MQSRTIGRSVLVLCALRLVVCSLFVCAVCHCLCRLLLS